MFGRKKEVPTHEHGSERTFDRYWLRDFVACTHCGFLVLSGAAQCIEAIRELFTAPDEFSYSYYCSQHRKNYDRVVHLSPLCLQPGQKPILYFRKVEGHYIEVDKTEHRVGDLLVGSTSPYWDNRADTRADRAPKPKAKKSTKTPQRRK